MPRVVARSYSLERDSNLRAFVSSLAAHVAHRPKRAQVRRLSTTTATTCQQRRQPRRPRSLVRRRATVLRFRSSKTALWLFLALRDQAPVAYAAGQASDDFVIGNELGTGIAGDRVVCDRSR